MSIQYYIFCKTNFRDPFCTTFEQRQEQQLSSGVKGLDLSSQHRGEKHLNLFIYTSRNILLFYFLSSFMHIDFNKIYLLFFL